MSPLYRRYCSLLYKADPCLISEASIFLTCDSVKMGPRSFCVSGPMLWNSLPLEIRYHEQTLESFKAKLKTYLFKKTYFSWLSKYIENCAGPPVMGYSIREGDTNDFLNWIELIQSRSSCGSPAKEQAGCAVDWQWSGNELELTGGQLWQTCLYLN